MTRLTAMAALLAPVWAMAAFGQGVKPAPKDTDWIAPAQEKAKAAPEPATAEGLARGRQLFQRHCATCHGEKGRGDGPLARLHAERTSRAPYDLTLPEVQSFLTDGEIFWKVSVGYRIGDKVIMPSFRLQVADDLDRWRIVQFVRTLGPTP